MGLATIDPHSHKVQTKLYKIPKFGVNRPKGKQDSAIWKCPTQRQGDRMVFASICEHASSAFIFASTSSDQFSNASSEHIRIYKFSAS